MSNSDYGELVWENGQVVMKGGQSRKVPRFSNKDCFINSKTGISMNGLGLDEVVVDNEEEDDDVVAPWFSFLSADPAVHLESASGGPLAEVSGVTSNQIPSHASLGDQLSEMRLQKKQGKEVMPSGGAFNFPHFTRPSAKAKISLAKAGGSGRFVTHGTEEDKMLKQNNMAVEVSVEANAECAQDDLKFDEVTGESPKADQMDAGVFGAPSAFSGTSGKRAKNNLTHHLKRKHSLLEDCEDSSEDAEEQSVNVKKARPKRNRTAEVHSSSDRKRREKINDKMRALQDLVPHCNKVDEAAMLDEAIGYLRTLQLQVQMMSMRAQICTQPMMPQPTLQHLHAWAHLLAVPTMGLGYQTGVPDMSGGFPIQVMPFAGLVHPQPQLWNQAQGLPMSVPVQPPLVPIPAVSSTIVLPAAVGISDLKDPRLAENAQRR